MQSTMRGIRSLCMVGLAAIVAAAAPAVAAPKKKYHFELTPVSAKPSPCSVTSKYQVGRGFGRPATTLRK